MRKTVVRVIIVIVSLHAACMQVLSVELQTPKKLSWEQLNQEIKKSPNGNHTLYERRAVCYDKLGHHDLAVRDRRRSQNWQETIFDATPVRDSRNEK